MKIGLISDPHSNLPALTEVLNHMDKQGVDVKVCLGDLVGYGPNPNEVVEAIVHTFNFIVRGNHDEACVDLDQALGFNPMARQAIEWTAEQVTEENKKFLRNLEYGFATDEGLMFVHGSPVHAFSYIMNERDAATAFGNPASKFNIAFIGHTHVPMLWSKGDKLEYKHVRFLNGSDKQVFSLEEDKLHIVNVGSVGQPRDNDPRACYAIYDTEDRTLTYHRVAYPVDRTIAAMQRAGFQMNSWQRLMFGN